jgi:hypothetical protein
MPSPSEVVFPNGQHDQDISGPILVELNGKLPFEITRIQNDSTLVQAEVATNGTVLQHQINIRRIVQSLECDDSGKAMIRISIRTEEGVQETVEVPVYFIQ